MAEEKEQETVLRILSGEFSGSEFPLSPMAYTLGSANDCDIVIEEFSLLPKHVSITVTDSKAILGFLTDSKGKWFLNGELQQTSSKEIAFFDEVKIGSFRFGIGPADAEWDPDKRAAKLAENEAAKNQADEMDDDLLDGDFSGTFDSADDESNDEAVSDINLDSGDDTPESPESDDASVDQSSLDEAGNEDEDELALDSAEQADEADDDSDDLLDLDDDDLFDSDDEADGALDLGALRADAEASSDQADNNPKGDKPENDELDDLEKYDQLVEDKKANTVSVADELSVKHEKKDQAEAEARELRRQKRLAMLRAVSPMRLVEGTRQHYRSNKKRFIAQVGVAASVFGVLTGSYSVYQHVNQPLHQLATTAPLPSISLASATANASGTLSAGLPLQTRSVGSGGSQLQPVSIASGPGGKPVWRPNADQLEELEKSKRSMMSLFDAFRFSDLKVQIGDEPMSLVVTGYTERLDDWNKVRTMVTRDLTQVDKIKDEVETPWTRMDVLKTMISERGLDEETRVYMTKQGIIVKTSLSQADEFAWAQVEKDYRNTFYGIPKMYRLEESTAWLDIKSVNFGNEPYLVTASGQKFTVGSVVKNNYRVERISADGIVLSNGESIKNLPL